MTCGEVSLTHFTGWQQTQSVDPSTWVCGFCTTKVHANTGYIANGSGGGSYGQIKIRPNCGAPSVFDPGMRVFPPSQPGDDVPYVPTELGRLYDEARSSVVVGAFTGSVMLSRKMLMNIAVAQGASSGLSFVAYVEYLADKGFVPPNGKPWVDFIRQRGNEANREIAPMTEADARTLIVFVEMLLRFVYEFPQLVPKSPP